VNDGVKSFRSAVQPEVQGRVHGKSTAPPGVLVARLPADGAKAVIEARLSQDLKLSGGRSGGIDQGQQGHPRVELGDARGGEYGGTGGKMIVEPGTGA
jgi:hypothetical protein